MKRKTFKDVREVCKKYQLQLLTDESDETPVYKVLIPDYWKFKCFCGKEFSTMLCSIYSENTKSCGCRNIQVATDRFVKLSTKYTFGQIRQILSKNQLELISNESDDKLIYDATVSKWTCRCRCGKIFQRSLVRFYNGLKSCGCLKSNEEYIKENHKKKTIYTFTDVIKACNSNALKFLNDVDLNSKIYKTDYGNWPVQCFCGKIYMPDLGSLIYQKSKSCGCVKSKTQADIANYIESLGISVKRNDRTEINPKEIDIFCPENKIAVEYCGLYWHGNIYLKQKAMNCHYDKMKECEAKGIRLITIFENEWLERPEVVKGYLRAILGRKVQIIGARKCEIKLIESSTARVFCERYHIQGKCTTGVNYGLFYGNEMIACAIYNHLISPGNLTIGNDWNLARYCVKEGLSVPGGLSKIQKQFILENKPFKIISYSDNRWSIGKIYQTLGFEKASESGLSYQYFKTGTQGPLMHKSFGRKSAIKRRNPEIYNPNKTEWAMMQEAGYDRIWDCGKIKWVLKIPQ
jgi:hypothetical protein